jgi:hypothetical protein
MLGERDKSFNMPITFKVDRKTADAIKREAGPLTKSQFVRMVLMEGIRIREDARSSSFKARIGVRSYRS